ncbi:HNH endonuclease [Spectribacter hydrogenooxidans]|uniref:HNH domain-containing protein n=1 Tax=Spectribacter hydrogenoxidans TaxID=3075608 RepID=A0ABU3BVL1_9GAMM|nr:hypothetical protein [Salinisphaera sp. W335]MDT0633328.1 hypothetical protein [Salinisphaera sp. W335]
MWLEPQKLQTFITRETGLAFKATTGIDGDGQRWYALHPVGPHLDQSFAIRTTVGWRRFHISFEPGKFAGDLLSAMGRADETGRAAFQAVLSDCRERGAQIETSVNGYTKTFDGSSLWNERWTRFHLKINKGQIELGAEDGEPDDAIIRNWTGRFAAAIVAILPLEEEVNALIPSAESYPEGALTYVQANRYERDRRNRAAAISIHGTSCAACGMDFGQTYGPIAVGHIEVHHTTPVSELGPGYVINPARDLIPLCANCHTVAHKRNPPFTADEIADFMEIYKPQT